MAKSAPMTYLQNETEVHLNACTEIPHSRLLWLTITSPLPKYRWNAWLLLVHGVALDDQ